VGGKPAHNAIVLFHPRQPIDGKPLKPMAIVAADGTFRPTTYRTGDGLPAGDYGVTVSWPEIIVVGEEEIGGDDRLGRKYSNPAKPVLDVHINPGENQLPPIDLNPR
jgi:hypothetical protein